MKLTVFLILLGLLRVSAVTNAQVYRINLELENVACEEAIESLKGQTNLDFFFSNREVNVNRKVSVSCKNASLEEALKQILGEGYSFRLIDNTVVIRPVKNQLPQPKQVTVKGTVKDVKGNPLPGVTVLLKGSALGISTDNDGKFTVSFPEMKDVVLLFSFIGMKSQEVKYTGQMDIIDRFQLKDQQRVFLLIASILYRMFQFIQLTQIFFPSIINSMKQYRLLK